MHNHWWTYFRNTADIVLAQSARPTTIFEIVRTHPFLRCKSIFFYLDTMSASYNSFSRFISKNCSFFSTERRMEFQKCIILVHDWLKEHGFQKTCEALVDEYGPIETPLLLTLTQILQSISTFLQVYTDQSLSSLLGTIGPKPPDPIPKSLKEKARRKEEKDLK